MFKILYDVRILDDGKLVTKKRFAAKTAAVNWLSDKLKGLREGKIRGVRVFELETFQNSEWGLAPHDPWQSAPTPVSTLFIHHSVTTQLPKSASVADEKEQMRILDQIAHGRGFNGISYCWVIFPSGRCYEGRGWGVVEAATEGHNTDSDSIVFAGNYSSFALSEEQQAAVRALINKAQAQGFLVKSGLDVRAHRETSQTSCPGAKITDAMIAGIQKAVN